MLSTRPTLGSRTGIPLFLLTALLLLAAAASSPAVAQGIPSRISDQEFWRMVTEFSEPGGYFRSENFVGNETSLQHPIPELVRRVAAGGVYLGVAPDQNFTFIVALKPKIAFIVDIRRQNMIHHLLYKAIIELAPTRTEFLSLLFSRERAVDVPVTAPVDALLSAYYNARPSLTTFEKNFGLVKNHLIKTRGFALSSQDTATLRRVYESFFDAGPYITYSYPSGGGGGGRGMPTYADMVSENDGQGARRSYLASEENYRTLREFQRNNLLVPLVGDFSGPKALRTVGQYVRDRGAVVTTFYTSNVEQYLFMNGDEWYRFYTNVATLPLDASSTLIRSVPNNSAYAAVSGWPGTRSTMLLSNLGEIVSAFKGGKIVSYVDVIRLSK